MMGTNSARTDLLPNLPIPGIPADEPAFLVEPPLHPGRPQRLADALRRLRVLRRVAEKNGLVGFRHGQWDNLAEEEPNRLHTGKSPPWVAGAHFLVGRLTGRSKVSRGVAEPAERNSSASALSAAPREPSLQVGRTATLSRRSSDLIVLCHAVLRSQAIRASHPRPKPAPHCTRCAGSSVAHWNKLPLRATAGRRVRSRYLPSRSP